jgi:phosphate transport system substrate-binding protein
MPLPPEDLKAAGLIQFPTVVGGDVPVVNLDGVAPGQIVLDGPTLANIFMGKITSWDDAAIKKLNPTVKLPSTPVVVVHRSDGSGTTFIWTSYLSKVSEEWKAKVGANTAVEWPVGIGAKGNEGVASTVATTKGAIGYVEYAYVKQNKMTYANVINKDGKTVAPNSESFQAAAANADWAHSDSYYVILTDQSGAKTWPVAGATFILMHKLPQDAANSTEALKFFDWAYAKGGSLAESLDYVPMPSNVIGLIKKTWASEIKTADGKMVYDGK